MTMIVINIFEAKSKLSEYIDAIERGERVLICKRNRPVAELRPVAAARTEPRPLGLGKGRVDVTDAFFEPLPEDVAAGFWDDAPGHRTSKVAEPRPADEFSKPLRPRKRR